MVDTEINAKILGQVSEQRLLDLERDLIRIPSSAFEEGETALDLAIGFTSPVPADIVEDLIGEDLQRLGGQSGTAGQVQVFGSGSLIMIRAVVDTEAAMDRAFDFGGL